ncbi:hypothetical protein FBUS_00686 [Fasciolopsis buskii]|uniref:Uncharacterized protein n=1 Tax=Fasciolopsis buskii TaxID=27845 RepID=A0A8E0VMA1_9TREM|nr:hypothetical protein FBUS_00686 [Fasciolopsis buski]
MSTEYAASYPGDMDPSSRGDIVIRQNQMLPIYCSIMGMIIISLLLYVIYKLWKQREAMASAKLSEVFANGTGNGLDKALIRTSNTPNTTTTTITTTASAAPSLGLNSTVVTITEAQTTGSPEGTYDPTHHRTQSISSETRSHGKRSDHKVPDSHTDGGMSEKHPLITGAHNSLTDQDYMEQPLNSVPRDTLGFVCYNLAQKGWRELAFTTGASSDQLSQIDQLSSNQRAHWSIPGDLLQATQYAQSLELTDGNIPLENDIKGAVLTVGKLMGRPDMTLSKFCAALEQCNRSDLVQTFTTSSCLTSTGA